LRRLHQKANRRALFWTLQIRSVAAILQGTAIWTALAVLPLAAQGGRENPFEKPLAIGPQEATSYFDLPVDRLRAVVPGLRGVAGDANQSELPTILAGLSRRIAETLPKLPDLISREQVFHFQSGGDADPRGGLAATQPYSREFKYLIRCRRRADGSTDIEEARVNSKGEVIEGETGFTALRGTGFANQWLFFSAANQPQFRFRYLGRQQKDGHKTYVVVFAQDPKKVDDPAYFEADGKKSPFYYQGVLWVDPSSFDIVALHTDLLAPLRQVHLLRLATDLKFHSVPIRGYNAVFWLPSEVDISSDEGQGPTEESHHYSDYHLFHAEARIVSTP